MRLTLWPSQSRWARAAALLIEFVVQDRGALIGRPQPRRCPRGVEQSLAQRGLALVAMADDGNGADPFRRRHRHGLKLRAVAGGARCMVGRRHGARGAGSERPRRRPPSWIRYLAIWETPLGRMTNLLPCPIRLV